MMRPIVWTEPWYRDAHNNIRHTNLLKRFTLVEPIYQFRSTRSWQGQAHRFREKQGAIGRFGRQLMALYWQRYAKTVRPWFTFQLLNRKYQLLFCTSDHLYQIAYFDGPVVVDDDDPIFDSQRISILNAANVGTVVTTTKQLKAQFIEAGLERPCRVVPSGIDLLSPSAISEAVQDQIEELKKGYQIIGYMVPKILLDGDSEEIGSAEEELYSVSFLLEIMKLVWDQRGDVHLWLIGEPSQSVKELSANEPRIRLLGYISESVVTQYISHFDIAVYPRQIDLGGRQSIKLLQFMASGVPIVSTDVAEAFVVREAESGILAKDEAGFVDGLIHLIDHPDEGRKLAESGKAFSKLYSWDEITRNYEDEIFLPLLEKKGLD